jgi:hypothetical protein
MTPETRAYVDELVAAAPPLTDEQRQQVAALIRPHLPAHRPQPLSA